MSRKDKLEKRLLGLPSDFTWQELVKVLKNHGYQELKKKGKTGGSRRKFMDAQKNIISLHEPHPRPIVKKYALKEVIEKLGLK